MTEELLEAAPRGSFFVRDRLMSERQPTAFNPQDLLGIRTLDAEITMSSTWLNPSATFAP